VCKFWPRFIRIISKPDLSCVLPEMGHVHTYVHWMLFVTAFVASYTYKTNYAISVI